MLRVVAHKSAAAALKYFDEGLKREDYYAKGQEVPGKWHGRAAKRLGLSGNVERKDFAALVENRHPETGARLTPRTKMERRVGYDLTFSVPKSVSLLHALGGDTQILAAFREAVVETMAEVEALASTRVRKGGAQGERITGNLAWAEFVHFTSRPVGGIPDCHLHCHVFAPNLTFDEVESRWKAASWMNIKKDAPYSDAVFEARLAHKLVQLGYEIERTSIGWEIAGIPRSLVDKFSRRTAQIEKLAREKGITNPKDLDALGALTREGKRRGLTHEDLKKAWEARLSPEEKELISKVASSRRGKSADRKETISPRKAFDDACEKLFAKSSVIEVKRLLEQTLRYGVGQITPEAAWSEFMRRDMIVKDISGETLCTSVDVLSEEIALINFVRTSRGTCAPLVPGILRLGGEGLSAEYEAAARHVLKSNDQVIGVRGAAGTGKTTLMREVARQIEAAGLKLFAFAPSADASRGKLREDGFTNAETVAHLLMNKRLQEEIRGQVIWIDEAGTIGIADMAAVMRLAGSSTWVILTGDTAQHAPIPRGDPFRLVQAYAGLKVAELTEIHRQQREVYRKAVAAFSKGDLRTGFRRLDELGAIVEVADDAERYRMLAEDYLHLSRRGSVLVVSPTHAEGAKVTEAIREARKQAGQLGPEKLFTQFQNLQWEEPDRRRSENFAPGLVVQFHQNAPGIPRGTLLRVVGIENGAVLAAPITGDKINLPLEHASRFLVYEERQINLAAGDRIRITRGGESENGRRLNNGNLFTIRKIGRDGAITLNTGAVLGPAHGHLTHGYCQTSHAAQGQSVQHVLVAQSADSFFSSSREGFYVSVSRAKESVRVYTDDRLELERAVGFSSARTSGIELAGFSAKEVAGLMSGELNGRQWQDLIRSRVAEGAGKTHGQNVLHERGKSGLFKPGNMDFRQYIAMRRQMVGADGKSRSKGQPSQPGQKKGTLDMSRRSFIRPTELTEATKAKIAANQNQKPGKQTKAKPLTPRQGMAVKAFQAAKTHFAKIAKRTKTAAQSLKSGKRPKLFPEPSAEQVAKRRAKKQSGGGGAKTQTKAKTQNKAPTPPAPTWRK
jgi:conjugative relaxase-like TrwC/TraI family protein